MKKKLIVIGLILAVILLVPVACATSPPAPWTGPVPDRGAPAPEIEVVPAPVPAPSPTPAKTEVDTPVFRNDEVCALVYNYLDNKATSITDFDQRKVTLYLLGEARPYFSANYQGNGKWVVLALGIGEINWTNNGGLWNLYEASRAIEPANDQATKLLGYIKQWAITKIEGKETTPTSIPTTSPEPRPTTSPEPIPTPIPTPTPTPTPTKVMPERTALIGGSQYPKPGASPVLTSSNWVVSRFENSGELPTVPNLLLPLFRGVKAGDKLPLNAEISIPSSQFWNSLLPSKRQTMQDIVEWYGMPAKDYLWIIASMTPR